MHPLVVIIATSGRPNLLRRTLGSLAACEKAASYRETIVVENGSSSGAELVVRDFGSSLHARYMHAPQPNKSNALNAALRELGDCLVFFTDDDVRFAPNVLREYAQKAEELGPGHFFGGPTGVDYEQEPPAWLKKFLPASASGWQLEDQSRGTEAFFLGFNWAAFLSNLRIVGDFDISRGPGARTGSVGQETDMQVRLRKNGIEGCYLPTAMVWHYVPAARCSLTWVLKRAFRTGIWYGLDWPPEGPELLRYTRWKIRKWASKSLRVLRALSARNVETLFVAIYEFMFFAGYMYGARLVRKNPSLRRY